MNAKKNIHTNPYKSERASPEGPVTLLAFNFAMQRGYATSNPAGRTAEAK